MDLSRVFLKVFQLFLRWLVGLFPQAFPHFLVLLSAIQKDFSFNLHILKSGVAFLKISILDNEAVQIFCGGGKSAVFGQQVIFLAEFAVGGHLVHHISRHFHGVPNFRAIGKPVAVFTFSSPPLNGTKAKFACYSRCFLTS